jgi:L-asparaginase II
VSDLLAEVVRGPLVESRHRGDLVVLDPAGDLHLSRGEIDVPSYPRSCAKPLQLAALLDAGLDRLDLPDQALAVAAASHSGLPEHVDWVRRILAAADLSEADLDNTPGMPIDSAARRELVRAGHGLDSLHQNCSGKHAAMLATAAVNGWPTAGYRAPDHPVQVAIRERIERLAGEPVSAVTVDGCGAALFALTLRGLARAFLGLVTATEGSAEQRVGAAMRAYPELVGGPGRDVSELLRAVPGLVAKDGAEGVYAAASAELGAVAVKIEDGAGRARAPVMVAALRELGASYDALTALATVPVLGHGEPVGEVRAVRLGAGRDLR